jgi:hypothetical protein
LQPSGIAADALLLLRQRLVLRLPLRRRHRVENLVDRLLEIHVNHAIGFVEHDIVALVQHQNVALEALDQTAGRGDHNLDAARQLQRLHVDRLAADHRHALDLRLGRQLVHLLLDLLRELARRRHDNRVRSVGGVGGRDWRQLQNERHHRQQKRRRLARAGLGDAEHVAAGERDRQRLHLNRRRRLVAELVDGGAQRRGQLGLVPRRAAALESSRPWWRSGGPREKCASRARPSRRAT